MTGLRHCPTGRRPLSHSHANREGAHLFERCNQCGYFHQKPHAETSPTFQQPEITAETGPMRNRIAAHLVQQLMGKNPGHTYAVEVGGTYKPIEGMVIDGPTCLIKFYDPKNGYGEMTCGYNSPISIEVSLAESEDLHVRQHDQQLLDAVKTAAAGGVRVAPQELVKPEQASPEEPHRAELLRNANFGLRCFDYVSSAIGMLQNGEWAEQKPADALLADFEVQISELVGRANRFEEIQAKYAAAVSTLESLGYSYRVEGAAMWAPPHGSVPDFILWERGELTGMPPVKAQVVFDYQGRIGTGKVVGAGQNNVIIEEMRDFDGEPEFNEFCAELVEISIWPYSQVDHERAMELVEAMTDVQSARGAQRSTGSYYRLAFNLIKSGKV